MLSLAGSEFIFEETRSYVMQRKAFGKTIADLQVDLFFDLFVVCVFSSVLYFVSLFFLAWMNVNNRLCSTSWPS